MGFQQSFKALSDPTRREILRLLRDDPLPAGEITAHFQMTAATISHHLALLRDAGLVLDEKKGKFIYYELNTSVVDELLGWLTSLKGGTEHEKLEVSNSVGDNSASAVAAGGAAVDTAARTDANPLES